VPRSWRQIDVVQIHYELGQLYAYQGKMDLAIAQFTIALRTCRGEHAVARASARGGPRRRSPHKASIDNHLFHAPGDRCLLSRAA
jgi:hypothetical protein